MRSTARVAPVLAVLAALAMAAPRPSSAMDSPHDTIRLTNGCEDCHKGHNAVGSGLTDQTTKTLVCMQCHNSGNVKTTHHFVGTGTDQANLTLAPGATTGTTHRYDGLVTGNPSNLVAVDANAPTDSGMVLRLDGTTSKTINCSVCHDQNHQTYSSGDPRQPAYVTGGGWGRHFQRIANNASQLCAQCHQARVQTNMRVYTGNNLSHPFNVAMGGTSRNVPPLDVGGKAQIDNAWGTVTCTPTPCSTTSLSDNSKNWGNLVGYVVRFTSGTNAGMVPPTRTITSNTATSITYSPVTTAVPSAALGDTYEIDGDGNITNNIVLAGASGPSYAQGNVVCMSCHAPHFADSDSTTYDQDGITGGDGKLLRRTNKPTGTTAQIAQTIEACTGCHKEKMHNGPNIPSPKYGTAWGATWSCQTCHQPHRTKNLLLLRSNVDPTGLNKVVDFRSLTGYATNSFAWGTTTSAGQGPCEVCHTQTANPNPPYNTRFRNTGNADNHHTSDGTACTACHKHSGAFKVTCYGCHGDGSRQVVSYWTLAADKDKVRAAPPSDATGSMGSPKVGAHVAHVNRDASTTPTPAYANPFYCDQCHFNLIPTTYAGNGSPPDTNHGNNADNVAFNTTGIATNYGAITNTLWTQAPTGTTGGTCANTYCHGNFTPYGNIKTATWNDPTSGACGTCHGTAVGSPAPAAPHPPNTSCGQCHTGYTSTSTNYAVHINGTKDAPSVTDANQCTACHGDKTRVQSSGSFGTVDAKFQAAPPWDAHGNTGTVGSRVGTARDVGAHQSHINPLATNPPQLHAPLQCADCHVVPATALHANGSSLVTWGTLAKTGSVTPVWNGTTCSSTYCHGNWAGANAVYGNNKQMTWTDQTGTAAACGTCHGAPPPTNASSHHPPNPNCGQCHTGYTSTVPNLTLHINGSKDAPAISCTACHGDANRVANPAITVDAASFKAAPPWDAHGNTAGANGIGTTRYVGAHLSHVNPGIAQTASLKPLKNGMVCTECHTTEPSGTDTTHADGTTPIPFGTIAKTGGVTPTWNAAALTCSSTYCHGNFPTYGNTSNLPSWTTQTANTQQCGVCHGPAAGNPLPAITTHHPQNTNCGTQCHPAGYSTTTVNLTSHVNGVKDAPALSCNACHGDSTRVATTVGTPDANYKYAPPWDSHGNTLPAGSIVGTQRGVGAHLSHVNLPTGKQAIRNALACTECHASPLPTSANYLHADGTIPLPFGSLAKTNSNTPAFNGTSCSSTWCHRLDGTHGGTINTPNWTGTGQGACGTCHGVPPPTSAHSTVTGAVNCNGCHPGYNCANNDPANNFVSPWTACTVNLGLHVNGALDGGGECTDCHAAPKSGGYTWPARRQVVKGGVSNGDFMGRSHHVVGTVWNNEIVTKFDCLVCHAEGKVDPGTNVKVATTGFHNNGTGNVYLLNVDSPKSRNDMGYDPSTAGGVAGTDYFIWNSHTTPPASMRLDMDKFCLSCHDSNGALWTYNMNPADAAWHGTPTGTILSTTNPQQPFGNNDQVMSSTDGQIRGVAPGGTPPTIGGKPRGTVPDVKGQAQPGSKAAGVWTKFSWHALKYFGVSRYTATTTPPTGYVTITSSARFTTGNTNCGGAACADNSQLYCTDCHRVDINAHGAQNAEYFNKCGVGGTGSGGATGSTAVVCSTGTEDSYGNYKNSGGPCFNCHALASYQSGHTGGSGSDYVEASTAGTTPATRIAPNYNLYNNACLNCHAGATPGGIHGTSDTYGTSATNPLANQNTYTRKAWRFFNGASWTESKPSVSTVSDTGDPAQDLTRWSGTRAWQCYTLNAYPPSTSPPDLSPAYGACTKHGGTTSAAGNTGGAGLNRKLDY